MRISVLGLGRMGTPIARNLLEIGHEITLYNRTRDRALDLAAKGARIASTVADAAREAQVVLTMVSDDAAVEEVTFGPDGLLAHLRSGAIHLCMSSIGFETSRKLALAHEEAGQGYVAAPVFGRPGAASSRHLWIVAGGPEPHVIRCLPIFDALARGVTRVGPRAELAHAVTLGGNLLTVAMVEGLAEVLAYGEKAGMPPADYLRLLNTAIFKSPLLDALGGLMVRRSYDATDQTLDLATKDLKSAIRVAKDLNVVMPLGSSLLDRLESPDFNGWGELDLTVLSRMCRIQAGLEGIPELSRPPAQTPVQAGPSVAEPKHVVVPEPEPVAAPPRASTSVGDENRPSLPVVPRKPFGPGTPVVDPEDAPLDQGLGAPEAARTSLSEILMAFVPDFVRPFVTGKGEAPDPVISESDIAEPNASGPVVAEPPMVRPEVLLSDAGRSQAALPVDRVAEAMKPSETEIPVVPPPEVLPSAMETQAKVSMVKPSLQDVPKAFAVDLVGSFVTGGAGSTISIKAEAGARGSMDASIPVKAVQPSLEAASVRMPSDPSSVIEQIPAPTPAAAIRIEDSSKPLARESKNIAKHVKAETPLPEVADPSRSISPSSSKPEVSKLPDPTEPERRPESGPTQERIPPVASAQAKPLIPERSVSHAEEGPPSAFRVKSGNGFTVMDLHKTSHFEIVGDSVWAWVEGKRYQTSWRSLTEVETFFRQILFVKIQRHILLQPESVMDLRPVFGGRAKVKVGEDLELDISRSATSRLKEILGI